MRPELRIAVLSLALVALGSTVSTPGASDTAPIRIRAPKPAPGAAGPASPVVGAAARRAFNYEAFNGRLEALWFQRKAFLAAGRDADAAKQEQLIRSFCAEEGVRRLEGLSGALLVEARRYLDEGNATKALAAIEFAEFFAPGSSVIRRARAAALWKSGNARLTAAGEMVAAARAAVVEQWQDFSLANRMLLVFLVALVLATTLFAAAMIVRYQAPLRHEVEEWVRATPAARFAEPAGWAAILLPALVWIGAGWLALYWIVATYRYMRRADRIAALGVLLLSAAVVPAFKVGVALRGMTEDPMVRNTLAAAGGTYDPERVVKLQQLVESHPEDPTYRFLLAGLYKNGRYFEDSFLQYKEVLALDPNVYQAHLNIGNLFFELGQQGEANVHYRKALELRPDSALAYYDAYVAHSDSFKFKEAQEYLEKGNAAAPEAMAELLYRTGSDGGRTRVVDATVDLGSLWEAALEGRPLRGLAEPERVRGPWHAHLRGFLNPLSLCSLLAIVACPLSSWALGRKTAQLCVRCGQPFCVRCRTEPQRGKEYCSQCLHLFVLGDGLAAETKTRKLYEIERHVKRARRARMLSSLAVPGAGDLLSGRAVRGQLLAILWLTALLAWVPHAVSPAGKAAGLELRLGLLAPGVLPAAFSVDSAAILGVLLAVAVWLAGNVPYLRTRGA